MALNCRVMPRGERLSWWRGAPIARSILQRFAEPNGCSGRTWTAVSKDSFRELEFCSPASTQVRKKNARSM